MPSACIRDASHAGTRPPWRGKSANPERFMTKIVSDGNDGIQLALLTIMAGTTDDVVISGGGPSGLLAAIILARAGVRVRVLERATFPRDKLCGDTLNPGAIAALERHLDLTSLRPLSLPLDGMMLSGPGGVSVRGVYPPGVIGRALVRRDFDGWLAVQATAAGVAIEENCAVTAPLLRDGAVIGVRARDRHGRARDQHARLTLAADGRCSPLATRLGLRRVPHSPRRWAVGAYFEAVSGVATVGEMHIRPGRYLGLAPTPGGLTNVCFVTSPGRETGWRDPLSRLRAMIESDACLAARFAGARAVTAAAVLGPLAVNVPVPGAPGLLLTGDAAGFIDPMTGDGLRFALEGAELAAGVAFDVLTGEIPSAAAAAELGRRRQVRFARKWRFDRAVRRLVESRRGLSAAGRVAERWPSLLTTIIRYGGDCGVAASAPASATGGRQPRVAPAAGGA